jgi:hypothetical protein
MVAAIETNKYKEHIVTISDGTYSLRSSLITGKPPGSKQVINENMAEAKFKHLIDQCIIEVGQKLHFINQGIKKELVEADTETEHFFLQNQGKFTFMLNLNGLSPASPE